jgi:UDP-N-acetylmuramoylalanine--D-glutamate ligase
MHYLLKLRTIKQNPNTTIAILGYGVENKQFVTWLKEVVGLADSQILIFDPKLNSDNYLQEFSKKSYDLVIKTPGMHSLKPELIAYRTKHGSDSIISSLTFFVEVFRDSIVGVTGTKGKTTTCSLIKHFLEQNLGKKKVTYCGNTTNISPYQFWHDFDKPDLLEYFFILELSSFQLQDLGFAQISPKYAVVTNYYVDHLDQHSDELEYWQAKDNIFLFQKPKDFVAFTPSVDQNLNKRLIKIQSNHKLIDQSTVLINKNNYQTNLQGDHNMSNISLAIVVCDEICQSSKIDYQSKLKTFEAPKGRLELIKTVELGSNIIKFYNDNTATEPDAVMAAINTLCTNKTILLLTGKYKKGNHLGLAKLIKSKIIDGSLVDIYYFGPTGLIIDDLVENLFNHNTSPLIKQNNSFKEFLKIPWNLKQTITKYELAKNQTLNIVLSPSGSSFDEFNNYIERGDLYLKWVDKCN